MNTVSDFERLDPDGTALVETLFDGRPLVLPDGDNLAAALLAAGIARFRATPVSGAPRAPYCMMGACFECLVEIDGMTVQACMRTVQAGLVVTPGRGSEASDA